MEFLLDKEHLIIYNYQERNGKKMYSSHLIASSNRLKANDLYEILNMINIY